MMDGNGGHRHAVRFFPSALSGMMDKVWPSVASLYGLQFWGDIEESLGSAGRDALASLLCLKEIPISPKELLELISPCEIETLLNVLFEYRDLMLDKYSINEVTDKIWSVFVDGLILLSSIAPNQIRERLRYKFKRALGSEEWQKYRKEYSVFLGEKEWIQLFEELKDFSDEMRKNGKKKIVVVNATFFGGGVAEMIPGIYKFLKRFGIDVEWQIIHPRNPYRFYAVTKKIHNIIQGQEADFTDEDIAVLEEVGRDNFQIYRSWLDDSEIGAIFFEDPQVLSTMKCFMDYAKESGLSFPAIFRLHIDISGLRNAAENSSTERVWNYINGILTRLHDEFNGVLLAQPYLNPWIGLKRAFCQPPGIDILSDKNSPIGDGELDEILSSLRDKEIEGRDLSKLLREKNRVIVTGARADAWKGLLQVILAYLGLLDRYKVKGEFFPTLVVFAGGANDDPEVQVVRSALESVIRENKGNIYFIWNAQGRSIGALYRLAAKTIAPVVIASVREGYNLVIDEAIRQGALPITTNVGGLKRFERIESRDYEWIISLDDLSFRIAQPKDLMDPNSVVSKLLARKIEDKLRSFFECFNRSTRSLYEELVLLLQKQVFSTSLLPMARDYLKWTVKYARKNWS